MDLTRDIQRALAAPFGEDEIEFLPRATSNGKALALAYVEARSIMNRLDLVVGSANWSFDYDLLGTPGKSILVKGKLTVCGVTKADAGEGEAEDEALKSAVSDALKRCAVHFGIARYLYFLPRVWAAYDASKRIFTERPQIAPAAVSRALTLCGGPTPPREDRTVGQMRPPAPSPESRGDAQASQADHSSAGKGEREELIAEMQERFLHLHEGMKFYPWASEVLKREVKHPLEFADIKAIVRHLRTEEALLESGKAGAAPAQIQGA